MSTVKEQVRDLLEALPDSVTFEDMHYHLFVREKVEQGLKDIREGRILTEAEMEVKFKKWTLA